MQKPEPTVLTPELAAKNRRTAKWLCAGMLVVYNGFFASMTALNPNPPEAASRAFRFVAGNCYGLTAFAEPLPATRAEPMKPYLAAATCLLATAGLPGTLTGGLAPPTAGTRLAP